MGRTIFLSGVRPLPGLSALELPGFQQRLRCPSIATTR